MSLSSILSSFPTLRLPHSTQERLNLVLGTAAFIGTTTVLLPAAYRDYRTFKSYGQGGVPNNVIGWLVVRLFFQPFCAEMLDTEVYSRRIDAAEGHGKGDDGYLTLSEEQLTTRSPGNRPQVGPHVVPQRQLTQLPDENIKEKFRAAFRSFGLRNHHLVKFSRSNLEQHADGLFLADHLPITDLAVSMLGEVAHIHQGNDHSAHVVLAPADCKRVIEAGWGQRHGFSGTSAMTYLSFGTLPDLPAEYILIYAPRTKEEIQIVMQIISASVMFMTGREDTRSPDSQTVELDREYLDTITVQGREYQKYSIDHRIYFGPVDDEEAARLDEQQRVFQRIFDDRLIFPPIRRPRRVLDCGHGSASWAVEVAEQYPDCEVIGVDIAPHMSPDDVPDNLWLQVDDLNRNFTFPSNHFDLVQSRLLATGIHGARWPTYIRDIVRVLKRGGWVQMIELYFNVQSDNGSITDEHALRRWSTQYMRALEDKKDLRVGSRLRNMLTSAGLTEVDTKMIPLPLSAWSNDRRTRDIGQANSDNIPKLLRSLALYPLTQRLHMSPQSFDALIVQAQEEAKNPSLKAYFPL